MISINLLPHPRPSQRRKQMILRGQIGLGIGFLLLTICFCLGWKESLTRQYELVLHEKQEKEQQLAALRRESDDVDQLEKTYAALLEDMQSLEDKDAQMFLPIVLLDAVSRSLESLDLWLLQLTLQGQVVEIEGQALNRGAVGQFLDNIEGTHIFVNLNGVETQAQHDQEILGYWFRVNFTIGMS